MADNHEKLEFPVIENFSPEVPVEILGIGGETTKFVAIVDTGNTGFLQIPLAIGIKANLRLMGTRNWEMADGRKVKMLDCLGKIRFGGKEIVGIVNLSETSEDCLLGMQFLEQLKMDFTVSLMRNKAIFQKLENKSESMVAEVVKANEESITEPKIVKMEENK